jgi:hypothetical protein
VTAFCFTLEVISSRDVETSSTEEACSEAPWESSCAVQVTCVLPEVRFEVTSLTSPMIWVSLATMVFTELVRTPISFFFLR